MPATKTVSLWQQLGQSKVNAKIFITFESHDKTCSRIEKTWFLLVNWVAKKQLSE